MTNSDRTERSAHQSEGIEQSTISLAHFFGTLRKYQRVIALAVAIVALAYGIVALGVYVLSPSETVTSIPFRLEFEGAERGQYPNGMKFSSGDFTAEPILLRVFQANRLERFVPYNVFKDAVYVQESSRELERLRREFESRLNDAKLTAVDRDRIENEYQLRVDSLRHADYSLNLVTSGRLSEMPRSLREKTLNDILSIWADIADRERGALKYRVPLLTANVVPIDLLKNSEPLMALDILRIRIMRLAGNATDLYAIPGADVVRVGPEKTSLDEIRLNLRDIIHIRIMPMMATIYNRGLVLDPRSASDYLHAQQMSARREVDRAEASVDTLQNAFAMYTGKPSSSTPASGEPQAEKPTTAPLTAGSDGVIPQLSDSFLDRLVRMATDREDSKYRQDLLDKITKSTTTDLIPSRKEAAYYDDVLRSMPTLGSMAPLPAARRPELDALRANVVSAGNEVIRIAHQTEELYRLLSKNLNPQTELYTRIGPATSGTLRSASLPQLFLIGVLVIMLAFPVIVVSCLIHNRVREEEEEEEAVEAGPRREAAAK